MKKKFFVTITITTIFVSLFSIMSTQAALPSNFRFITPSIACSGAGTNAEYMEMKQTHEISAILNLRIGHPDDESYLENKGFVCLYVPIEDSYPPTQSQAIKCINFINQSLAEGRKVLVHCAGGYARSTTIVAIWLISQGYRAEQAINLIFLHPDTGIDDKQRDFLYQFDSQYPDQTTKVDTSMVVSSNYSGNQTFNVTGTLTGEFYPSYAIIGRIIYSPVELSTTWGYSTFIMTDVNGNFEHILTAPTKSGTYDIVVSFIGDQYFAGCQNTTHIVVEGTEPSTPPPNEDSFTINQYIEAEDFNYQADYRIGLGIGDNLANKFFAATDDSITYMVCKENEEDRGAMIYLVDAPSEGTYYIWLKTWWLDGGGDSFGFSTDDTAYFDLDNNGVINSDDGDGFFIGNDGNNNNWKWINKEGWGNNVQKVHLNAGLNRFVIWDREDGARIDKLIIANSSSFVPSG